jgi:hypothetical protein
MRWFPSFTSKEEIIVEHLAPLYLQLIMLGQSSVASIKFEEVIGYLYVFGRIEQSWHA